MTTSQDRGGRTYRSSPTPASVLPPSLSINSDGSNPPGAANVVDNSNPKNTFATSQSVHPQGPYGQGLMGGDSLDADAQLLLAVMQEQQRAVDRQRWVTWVNEEYVKAKNTRANFERQWYLNLAFVGGRQYVAPLDVAGVGFRLTVPKSPPWRVRLVINKIRMAVRKECSKLASSKPIPTVVPATGENEDFAAAKVGEALVRTQFADGTFGQKYRSWIWWGVVCGNSFIKSYWDANCVDYDVMQLPDINQVIPKTLDNGMSVPPEMVQEVIQANPRLQEFLNTPQPSKGKIKYEVVTPFHVFVPDLMAEELEDQPYIIQVTTRTPEWVKKSFSDAFPGDVQPVSDAAAANTIMDSVSLITKNAGQAPSNAVLVKEAWIKPGAHPDFPEGGMLTIINDKVVQEFVKWPCPFPEYPYYAYYGIPTGGFYRDSSVQDLIPLQKEYNRKRSQAIEIQNTMGKPKLLYPTGSINPKMITSEPGQSIGYTPGYEKPQILNGAEVPTSFSNEIATLTQEFDDISGQHDISRGDAPSDVKSGTAISFLAEQDDTALHYQVAAIEAAMEVIGKHHLSYASTYWDGDRLVKIVGRDNEYEALSWKQNALKGNTDVRIQSGSALPVSKAARTAQITEFMMNGWLPPEQGFEMMNLGGMDKVMDELLVDKRQSYRENLKMAQAPAAMLQMLLNPAPGPNGEPAPPPMPDPKTGKPIQINFDGTPFMPQPPIPVNSWDNHEAHIQYHNDFRKTQEFEVLPEENKQAFELHIQMHMMAMRSMMVNAQGQELTDNPNPPPPPMVDEAGNPIDPAQQDQQGPPTKEAQGNSSSPGGGGDRAPTSDTPGGS